MTPSSPGGPPDQVPEPSPPPRVRATGQALDRPPPTLVRQVRGGVGESRHRGSIVQADVDGAIVKMAGDPETLVNLRSTVKPFGLVTLIEDGGVETFDLTPAEIAAMAGSHSGEDQHVRTVQAVLRRAGLSQQLLACGAEGAPLDTLTAARLARDGERPSEIRHMCSGQHASLLLLCRMNDWPFAEYWRPEHPVQRLYAETVACAFGTSPALLITSIDGCGLPTYAFPLREVARAYALLADPSAVGGTDPRSHLAPALTIIRDAMLANPEMVAGSRDRLDTAVMKAGQGRVLAKGGSEGLRCFGLLSDERLPATGLALKIEDGGGFDRAVAAASVEALRLVGALDADGLEALGPYHRPASVDPRGQLTAQAVAEFELLRPDMLLG